MAGVPAATGTGAAAVPAGGIWHRAAGAGKTDRMCRNIRTLHHFEPPTTPEEIHAASLQYVRKVSGIAKPSHEAEAAFARAVEKIAAATTALLGVLPARGEPRTREGEKVKAKARWARREQAARRT